MMGPYPGHGAKSGGRTKMKEFSRGSDGNIVRIFL